MQFILEHKMHCVCGTNVQFIIKAGGRPTYRYHNTLNN